jgi:Zn-finger nucleic acid-binding protein
MEINIFEYSVICPECKTKSVMVVADTGLTIYTCGHCSSNIMLYGNKLYTLREEFLRDIIENYSTEECGSIVFTRKHRDTEEFITKDKIDDLKKRLKDTFFIEDFLKNL